MWAEDLPACEAIGDKVHEAHPEDSGRMEERFRLFPGGCFVWRRGDRILGYAVAHPWRAGAAVPLNAAISDLPAEPDTLYLHDLALLPEARGLGAGLELADRIAALAGGLGYPAVSIVAVGGTRHFWERAGFRAADLPALLDVLRTYDEAAVYMQRPVGHATLP